MQSDCKQSDISKLYQKRLMKDLRTLQDKYTADEDGISAYPLNDSLLEWNAVICGPEDTIWDGGMFRLRIKFTEEYPLKAPKLYMRSKGVVHPNICPITGWICLDLFKDKWNAAYDVATMLISVRSILNEPNLGSMANPEAGAMYNNNFEEYKKLAEQAVENSLMDDEDVK